MTVSSRRIFQIGFNRCGTTSLYRFFHDNGIPAIHWDEARIAHNFKKRKAAGEDPFADYPDTVFFSDMGSAEDEVIEPYKDFRYILKFYPDAYFILNVRNVRNWLASRGNHPGLIGWHRKALGLGSSGEVLRHWERDWESHTRDVMAFFADRPGQLLVFDIEEDDPQLLVDFLAADFALDPGRYRQWNPSSKKRFAVEGGRVVKIRKEDGSRPGASGKTGALKSR